MKIYKFTNDLCITTSLRSNHGISGHVFELIEYFYYFYFLKHVDAVILVPFDIKKIDFFKCLDKYNFTEHEKQIFRERTFFNNSVHFLYCRNIIFTDGSIGRIQVASKNIIFLRCYETEDLERADVVLQDTRLYDPLNNSVHYVKKLLLNKYKNIEKTNTKTALIYATTNCRKLDYHDLVDIKNKYCEKNGYDFKKFLLVTNQEQSVPDKFELALVPVGNIFEKFDCYIYTKIKCANPFDCSPRFPVECAFYKKEIITDDIDYLGLKLRLYDIKNNFGSLFLTDNDEIIDYLK